MSRIAVFGANGAIGRRLVAEAARRGHEVLAVVRDPAKADFAEAGVRVVVGDVLDSASVAAVADGQDVLVSAVGGGDGPGHVATIEPAARSLVAGLRSLGANAPRLIVVGGAGSLRKPDGGQVWDSEGLPEFLLQIMHAHGDALDYLRTVDDVRWTVLSPAGSIAPGERTGVFRTGLEDLVVAADGTSSISTEDYAVALLDEAQTPKHERERFTVGY